MCKPSTATSISWSASSNARPARRSQVEDYLNELTSKGTSSFTDATENVREYVQQAADRIQEGSQQAMDTVRDGYEQAEDMIRQRPTESMAFCFGIGVFVGLLIGASLRSR